MVARVTRLVAEKFVLSIFPRALTTLSSIGIEGAPGLESSPGLIMMMDRLGDEHGVRRVHVLPCASNAACVFFGQSFDSYHPELVIYDFAPEGGWMVPRLRIANVNNESKVKPVGATSK